MIEAEGRHLRGRRGLRLLPGFLFDTNGNKAAYVVKAWLLAFLPSIVLASVVTRAAPGATQPELGATGSYLFFMLVVFAPLAETALMLPPLLLLNRFMGPVPAILGSALLWGVLHSLAAPVWGLIVWWPFLVFSTAVIAWKERSLWTAYFMVAAIHALQNAVAGASLFLP